MTHKFSIDFRAYLIPLGTLLIATFLAGEAPDFKWGYGFLFGLGIFFLAALLALHHTVEIGENQLTVWSLWKGNTVVHRDEIIERKKGYLPGKGHTVEYILVMDSGKKIQVSGYMIRNEKGFKKHMDEFLGIGNYDI